MFFKKKSSATEPQAESVPVAEGTVETLEEISKLLIMILEEKFPVRVFLGNSSFPYYSHFEWELLEDDSGKIVDSKAHLEQGAFLLLAALDPPIGNLKIRTASEINIEFFTKRHLLNCSVSLKKITGSKKLSLSFPQKLAQKPQRRSSFRAPIARSMDIIVSVTRPSGIAFGVKLSDLSVGGTSFYPTGATPRIADHSRVELDIRYPEGQINVDAIILGSFSKDGEQFFRSQFLVADHKTASDLGELVNYLQRESVQKRVQTFE